MFSLDQRIFLSIRIFGKKSKYSFDHIKLHFYVDASTYWLNNCLQLLLMVVDRVEAIDGFSSDLGLELLKLKNSDSDSLDPILLKDILTTTEELQNNYKL